LARRRVLRFEYVASQRHIVEAAAHLLRDTAVTALAGSIVAID